MIEIEVKKYQCSCGQLFDNQEECERCESVHEDEDTKTAIGKTVWFDNGSYGSEQGQRDMSWYSKMQEGVVIDRRKKGSGYIALVEYEQGERQWICGYALYRNSNKDRKTIEPIMSHSQFRAWMTT